MDEDLKGYVEQALQQPGVKYSDAARTIRDLVREVKRLEKELLRVQKELVRLRLAAMRCAV